MTEQLILKNFGFVGFGLIGGSIAHAIREIYPESYIIAYNYYRTKPHKKLERAKADGILNEICTSLSDFSQCDIIFLCAPVLTNISYLKELVPYISEQCIITDVGSVKGNIHHTIESLGLNSHFVGGHPMTGSEKTGYANSDSSYLKDAYYILTPTNETPKEYTLWLKNFIISAGSHCEIMDYETHDKITAAISHCPHLISASLINTVANEDSDGSYARLAAGGLKDITRISSSSPEMWQNICLSNPDAIISFLDKYIVTLTDAKNAISNRDEDKLMKIFENAKKYRDNLN